MPITVGQWSSFRQLEESFQGIFDFTEWQVIISEWIGAIWVAKDNDLVFVRRNADMVGLKIEPVDW